LGFLSEDPANSAAEYRTGQGATSQRSNGFEGSARIAVLSVDGIFVGPGLGPIAARELVTAGLAHGLARMGALACGILAAWLALIALSR